MNDIPAQLLDWETRFFLTRGPTPQAILAQVMDVGEMSDFETLDQLFSIETLRDVVSCSHPLWFRPKSWAFWHMQLFGTASFDELPPPPHWAIDMKHPADADLHVIPPEHAQAAIEWLAQLNQITPVIEATAGFMDDRPPDVVQRTAIALKAAGILSRRQYGRLLAQYVKYRAFLNPVNASSKLNELLAQCDAEIPLDECDQAWLNAPAVGLEIIDDNPSPEVEFTPFLQAHTRTEKSPLHLRHGTDAAIEQQRVDIGRARHRVRNGRGKHGIEQVVIGSRRSCPVLPGRNTGVLALREFPDRPRRAMRETDVVAVAEKTVFPPGGQRSSFRGRPFKAEALDGMGFFVVTQVIVGLPTGDQQQAELGIVVPGQHPPQGVCFIAAPCAVIGAADTAIQRPAKLGHGSQSRQSRRPLPRVGIGNVTAPGTPGVVVVTQLVFGKTAQFPLDIGRKTIA